MNDVNDFFWKFGIYTLKAQPIQFQLKPMTQNNVQYYTSNI